MTSINDKSTAIELDIQNVDGELLVDSRLVAEILDIQHKNVLANINKYLTLIEELGQLTFSACTVTNSVGARNTVNFVMLNEDQATFLMTLSNNTEAVIKAKFSLVRSFSAAKKLLNPDLNALDTLNSQIALDFEKNVYRPWRKLNINADQKFRCLVALPEIPQALEPSQPVQTPNHGNLLQLIDTLSLAANRAGLAGNKSTKEAEFLDKQLDKIRIQVSSLQDEKEHYRKLGHHAMRIALRRKTKTDNIFKMIIQLVENLYLVSISTSTKKELQDRTQETCVMIYHLIKLYFNRT